MAVAPSSTDTLLGDYILSTSVDTSEITGEDLAGTKNGVNLTFTLANPIQINSEAIYWNGLRLRRGSDYTIVGSTLTMAVAPSSTDTLLGDYILSTSVDTSEITGEDLAGTKNGVNLIFYIALGKIGSGFYISYSKLGTNTKLRSKQSAYSSMEATFYTASSSTGSSGFINSLITSAQHVLKADQSLRITLSDKFAYYRPQSGTSSIIINDVHALSPTGYLYNYNSTGATGSQWESAVIQMPPYYQSYDWFMDWMVVRANDAYLVPEVRSYSLQNIPNTVYYSIYSDSPISLLPTPAVGEVGGQWMFYEPNSMLYDISGNNNNIPFVSEGSPSQYQVGRDERRLCTVFGTGTTIYSTGSSSMLDFSNSFRGEAWVFGVDNTSSGSFTMERYNTVSNTGYSFGIDIDNQVMFIDIMNGVPAIRASSSIENLLNEVPRRAHYFGYTYVEGMAYFYLDGYLAGTFSLGPSLPTIPVPASLSVTVKGSGLGIDEVLWKEGFLTPNEVYNNFYNTKPRITRLGIPSGSVDPFYQTKVTMFASGSREIEFHQFTMRASDRKYIMSKDLYKISPYVVPIFIKY
jgi:hypothetical protein